MSQYKATSDNRLMKAVKITPEMLMTIEQIKDSIKHLKEENAKETSWGAAVGARYEEILELEGKLRGLQK
jgi:hypothetical protein